MASNSTKKNTVTRKSSGQRTTAAAKKTTANSSAASASKSSAGRKTSVSRKSSGTRSTASKYKTEEHTDPLLFFEIFLWIMLAVSVLLLISLFGIGGFVGEAVSGFCYGCFGVMAYPFPFMLFFMTAFLISNRRSRIAKIKAASVGGLYLILCGIMELLLLGYTSGYDLIEYYQAGVKYKTGGGIVGGAFVELFCPAIGVVGAYIILFIMAIICLVLITQRSLFAGVKHRSSQIYQNAREGQARRREMAAERREYYKENPEVFTLKDTLKDSRGKAEDYSILPKEPRISNRVSGVTTETDLSGFPKLRRDDIHEVVPKKTGTKIDVPMLDFTIQGAKPDYFQTLDTPSSVAEPISFEEDITEENDLPVMEELPQKQEEKQADEEVMGEEEPVLEPAAPASARQETDQPERKSQRKPHASAEEIEESVNSVAQEMAKTAAAVKPKYYFPPVNLLKKPSREQKGNSSVELRETAQKLQQTLHTFGVNVKITNVSCGPSVTRYELMPEMGVKVSRIVNLTDDIKLNLAAADIRIEAPIPGKAAVGIEVPNKESSGVLLRELLESDEFKNHPSNLAYAVGKDIGGNIIVSDIGKMPHLLIAGATGSGKSVFINTLIMSIIYKAKPDEVKMIMIDPKVVELSVYNGIPHLFIPVVTDPKKAAGALNWGVAEMTQRYQKFAEMGVRDLKGYNARIEAVRDIEPAEGEEKPEKLPQIVIIVDELADLMMVASGEVEEAICRLAQLARAAGIHLVIATQRPSVDVITGLIKANMPSRIAFSVSSGVDSRTILDMNGAEKLLGNGDMLFAPQTYKKPARIQGAFVSDKEVSDVVDFLKEKNTGEQYAADLEAQIEQVQKSASSVLTGSGDVDELFADAGKFIIEKDKASIGMLQRYFKIGFNRAARIMDQLSDAGVVGAEEGTKPRKIVMSMEQFENYLEEN
ncbi:MAG: DNA translocase FtsK [Lachnospiraceae bacterium]|nr:DNA translocase FtsK [Lachnospiraceae bacterium]